MGIGFFAAIIFVIKAIYAFKGWYILWTAEQSDKEIYSSEFFLQARQQLRIITVFSIIMITPVFC